MKNIDSIKSIIGYVKSISIVLILFSGIAVSVMLVMDSDDFGQKIVRALELRNSKKMTGGNIVTVIQKDNYFICIYEPVFQNNLYNTKDGFIQIDFISNNQLPLNIHDEIDYNNDNVSDFAISLNTKENSASLKKTNKKITGIMDISSITNICILKANNGQNTVFSANGYEKPEFLGYTNAELDSFEKIKKIVIYNERNAFLEIISRIDNGDFVENKTFHFISKFHKNIEEVALEYSREEIKGKIFHKIVISSLNDNNNQHLTIYTSAEGINTDFKAYPISTYNTRKTVRVLITR